MLTAVATLEQRLRAAGVAAGVEPVAAWRRLHDVEGARATLIDLYSLVAHARGLQPQQLPRAEREDLAILHVEAAWPGFQFVANSERSDGPIEVLAYDARWPEQYDTWRQRLVDGLHGVAVRIEHVGSTAVPGIAAKPIIDIQVSVADVDDEAAYAAPIEAAGLQLRLRDDEHRLFRPAAGRPLDVHVHVCASGSVWERRHVLLRDYLRVHRADSDAYAALKRQAAREWRDDRVAYTEAKSVWILDAEQRAAVWAEACPATR